MEGVCGEPALGKEELGISAKNIGKGGGKPIFFFLSKEVVQAAKGGGIRRDWNWRERGWRRQLKERRGGAEDPEGCVDEWRGTTTRKNVETKLSLRDRV